ncbi:MAG: prephenate dehydratase domain-containing protein [Gemmatimonadota bacterium]
MRIACQGPAGSYGHLAARTLYPGATLVPLADPSGIVRAVLRGGVEFGVVPVENSIVGRVADGERAVSVSGVVAVNEIEVPVRHCLLALPGATHHGLRSVESHPAALAQCAQFIVSRGLAARRAASTAGAAQAISQDRNFSCAAIAGEEAAELYGLTVLERDIADAPDNRTRFVVVAKAP